MSKTVAILQSSYIPWKGYFDIIHGVDEFVFLDDVQFTARDWRSRNLIKTPRGVEWLSVPVGNRVDRKICDVTIPSNHWQSVHRRTIEHHYASSPHFEEFSSILDFIYLDRHWQSLSDLNQSAIKFIAGDVLGVKTVRFVDSRQYEPEGSKQNRLIDILKKAGATHYVSGPAAKAYIETAAFQRAGIEVIWQDYTGYPEYRQAHPPFIHGVTILDLIFNAGRRAPELIWGWRVER